MVFQLFSPFANEKESLCFSVTEMYRNEQDNLNISRAPNTIIRCMQLVGNCRWNGAENYNIQRKSCACCTKGRLSFQSQSSEENETIITSLPALRPVIFFYFFFYKMKGRNEAKPYVSFAAVLVVGRKHLVKVNRRAPA